jgi:hypothetical protein
MENPKKSKNLEEMVGFLGFCPALESMLGIDDNSQITQPTSSRPVDTFPPVSDSCSFINCSHFFDPIRFQKQHRTSYLTSSYNKYKKSEEKGRRYTHTTQYTRSCVQQTNILNLPCLRSSRFLPVIRYTFLRYNQIFIHHTFLYFSFFCLEAAVKKFGFSRVEHGHENHLPKHHN